MGTHLRELSESYPMNTDMIGFGWFSKIFASLGFDESSLIIGRVNLIKMKILSLSQEGN